MRRHDIAISRIVLALLVACGSPPAPSPITNAAPPKAEPARTDTDDLLAMILHDFITDPKSMPDGGLVPDTGPIELVIEIEHGAPPVFARFPRGKRPFAMKTMDDIQREADATGKDVAYIHIAISFDATGAYISRGGDILLPKKTNKIKLCCCTSGRHYDKTATGWKPADTMIVGCG